MTKRLGFRGATVAVATIALLLGLGAAGLAQPPIEGDGSGTLERVRATVVKVAGPNVIEERQIEGEVFGALEGTYTEQVRGVIHPNGTVTFHGTMQFTGEVEGCGEGTLNLRLSGHGTVGQNGPVTVATAAVVGPPVDGFNVRGVATLEQNGPVFDYDVRYVCP